MPAGAHLGAIVLRHQEHQVLCDDAPRVAQPLDAAQHCMASQGGGEEGRIEQRERPTNGLGSREEEARHCARSELPLRSCHCMDKHFILRGGARIPTSGTPQLHSSAIAPHPKRTSQHVDLCHSRRHAAQVDGLIRVELEGGHHVAATRHVPKGKTAAH